MSNVIKVNSQLHVNYTNISPSEIRGNTLLILVRERTQKITTVENQIYILRKGVPFHTYVMNRMSPRHIFFKPIIALAWLLLWWYVKTTFGWSMLECRL